MAVIGDSYDPNKDNNQQDQGSQNAQGQQGQSQGQSVTGPVSVSGNSAQNAQGTSGQGGQGAQNSANPKGTSSGQFTNLKSYLNANSDYNQAGGGFGGQVNQNLQNQSNEVGQGIQNAQNNFNDQSQQNRVQYDANGVGQVLANPYQYTNATPTQGQTYNGYTYNNGQWNQNNTPVVGQDQQTALTNGFDQQGLQNFYNQRDATYKGPTSIDQDSTLQNQAQNFQQLANSTQSENGRFGLLRNMFEQPSYNTGQQTLDNLFLQADPNQVAQLQKSTGIANGLNNQLSAAKNLAQSQGTQYTNEAADTQNQTRNAISNAITQFGGYDPNSYVNQQVTNAQTNQSQALAAAQMAANHGYMSPADLARFGLTSGTQYYNVDPSQYLTQETDVPATRTNVLSQDDYNKINAYGKLAGSTLTGDPTKILSEFSDPSQAGQFANTPGYNFNTDAFNNAVQAAGQNYNTNASNIQGQIDSANAMLNGGDPNYSNLKGGVEGQIQTDADQIRSTLASQTPTYNTLKGMGMSDADIQKQLANYNPGYTNMNNDQLLQQYGSNYNSLQAMQNALNPGQITNTNALPTSGVGSPQWLLDQESFENNKKNAQMAALQNLQNNTGYGNVLGNLQPGMTWDSTAAAPDASLVSGLSGGSGQQVRPS